MFLVVSAPPRDSLWDKRTNTSLNVIAFIAPAAHDPTSTPKMQRDGRGNATELQGRSREKARERKGKFQRRQHILQRQRTSSTTQPASIHHSNATQANGHSNTLYQPPRKMKGISKEKASHAKCNGMLPDCKENATEIQGKRKEMKKHDQQAGYFAHRPKAEYFHVSFHHKSSDDTPRPASRLLLHRITLHQAAHHSPQADFIAETSRLPPTTSNVHRTRK